MEVEGRRTEGEGNWSEALEDLVDSGDVEGAISFLESLVSKLQIDSSHNSTLELSTALDELAKLYTSAGLSLKAEETRSRASLIKQTTQETLPSHRPDVEVRISNDALPCKETSDDDWEAIADRDPVELLSPQCVPGVSNLSLEDTKDQTTKRRGRGTFSYKKQGLYSDQQSCGSIFDGSEDEPAYPHVENDARTKSSIYGTRHVLVVADFPPSTKATELEKLFENFEDRGFVIRWVNDTVALAVFQTPLIALEAFNSTRCPFTVRVLEENDVLMSSISERDLEPPRQRPLSSASTAKRLIAHGMGLKLPSAEAGSSGFKKQEEARKNRIAKRQNLRDEAWGAD